MNEFSEEHVKWISLLYILLFLFVTSWKLSFSLATDAGFKSLLHRLHITNLAGYWILGPTNPSFAHASLGTDRVPKGDIELLSLVL